MRFSNAVAATVFASILFSVSVSRADEGAAPTPAPEPQAAPQPLPSPAAEQPVQQTPSGSVPPRPYYTPPYAVLPGQASPPCRPTWEDPCVPHPYPPPAQFALPMQFAPRVLPWNEGDKIPPGYYKSTEIRTGVVIGGAVSFGTAWLPLALLGEFRSYMAIPVAGPFMLAGSIAHADGGGGLLAGLFVVDGLQQVAGIVMVIAGLAAQKTVLLRGDVKASKTRWLPTPMSFGKGSAGLGIVGTM